MTSAGSIAADRRADARARSVLKDLRLSRVDEFRPRDRERFVQDFAQPLRQTNSDRAGVSCVNRNRERSGVAVVTVNRAVCFPDAVGVTGRMIVITNEKNFRPKILFQTVLGFNRRQVVAGGNYAAIEDNKVVFRRGEDNRLLRAGTEGKTSE